LTVGVDQPCAVMIDQSVEPIVITVSDPSQSKTALNVTLKFSNYPAEVMNFSLPTGDNTGMSVSKTAKTIRITAVQKVEDNGIIVFSTGKNVEVQLPDNLIGSKISVIDVMGRIISTQASLSQLSKISLPESFTGVAVLLVEIANRKSFKKLIIR